MTAPDIPPAPRRWDELLGQARAVTLLRSAAARPPHAILLVGSPTATRPAAGILARAIVCDAAGDTACGACPQCALADHPDLHTWDVAAGEATFKVEAVRALAAAVGRKPFQAARQVHVLAAADLMQPAGANALLKTLEEPPPATVLVLLARTADALLPTILSRCQVVPFAPVDEPVAAEAPPWPEARDVAAWSDSLAGGQKDAQQAAIAGLLVVIHREALAAPDDVAVRLWLARARAVEDARQALERHANARLVFDRLGRALAGGT